MFSFCMYDSNNIHVTITIFLLDQQKNIFDAENNYNFSNISHLFFSV